MPDPDTGVRGHRGAYGIAVAGLEPESRLLVPAEPDWPSVRIVVGARAAVGNGAVLDDDMAWYPDAPGGRVEVDRRAGVASFTGVAGLTPDQIVHPRLGMLAALYAQWVPGRTAFHAGGFVADDRAWGVVGGRQDGKSTLMAALALAGMPVLADDTLVVEGHQCLVGVRCVDLRPDAAARLGVDGAAATVRRGARARLVLPDAPRAAPLAGWLFLRWADELAVRELDPGERIRRIGRSQGWHRRGVTDPARLLELASMPAWELSRPPDWTELPRVVDLVRAATSG